MATGGNLGGRAMIQPVAGGVGAGIGSGATNSRRQSLPNNSFSSPPNIPISANSPALIRPIPASFYDSVFGFVPTRTEVEKAISDFRSFMLGSRSSESGWLHQMLQLYNPRIGVVADAFHLLQTESSVLRIVTSISTDKAVWNAILNNPEIQNLRDSPSTVNQGESRRSSGEDSDVSSPIIEWILNITREKILELVEKFISLVNLIFQPPEKMKLSAAEGADQVNDKLRSSVLLSVVILLIVVVTRAHGA
ncbi:hypothetical protein U1Q18_036132 [Sarracenia purpurea var. burkii]